MSGIGRSVADAWCQGLGAVGELEGLLSGDRDSSGGDENVL